jgi:hypothetical protein
MPRFSASPAGSRDGLIDLLVRHGLTQHAAQAVVAFGEELREQMVQEPDPDRQREHGGVLDARSGERLGPITAGTRTSVSFAEQIRAAHARGTASAAGVHTHAGSSSFSAGDAGLFDAAPVITVMVVTGPDGTWHVLSPEPGTTPPPSDEVEERLEVVLEHLSPTYRAMVNDGTLPPDRAWRELMHETWEIIAPTLGLRYDRLRSSDDLR